MKLLKATLLLLFGALCAAQNTESSASANAETTTKAGTTTMTGVQTVTQNTTVTMTVTVTSNSTTMTAGPSGNTTSTAVPKTTAPPPKTTVPPPTTMPPPNTYSVMDTDGNVCILAKFYVKFSGMYELKDKTKEKFDFEMPENAAVDTTKSRCGSAEQTAIIVLSWAANQDSMTLEFKMDTVTNIFQLKTANASLTHSPAHFPNSSSTGAVMYGGVPMGDFFKAELGDSFKCVSEEQIPYKNNDFQFAFKQLQLQPFEVEEGKFSKESPCAADQSPAHWSLKDPKGDICLLANFSVTFTGEYTRNDSKMAMFDYPLPQNAIIDTISSHCGNSNDAASMAVLTLTFDNGNSFTQMFQADSKTKSFSLVNATAMLMHNEAHFPHSKDLGKVLTYGGAVKNEFETGLGYSFKCSAMEKVSFTKDKFALSYTDMMIQPFDVDKKYGNVSECSLDTPTARPALPPMGSWNISSGGKMCMMMEFAAQFIITYPMEDMNKTKTGTVGYYLPEDLDTTKSKCSNKSATFVGAFSPDKPDAMTKDWSIIMEFTMNSDKSYAMTNYTVEYLMNSSYFPGFNDSMAMPVTAFNDSKKLFPSTAGNYYMCKAKQDVPTMKVTTTFMEMKLQPFAELVKDGGLGSPSDCAADNDVSNIVPIAVGCALAGLVVIVLIAYLIGRSRSNRSGYQSV